MCVVTGTHNLYKRTHFRYDRYDFKFHPFISRALSWTTVVPDVVGVGSLARQRVTACHLEVSTEAELTF